MMQTLARLARLAFFRHKREQVDPQFALRLQRLGTREGLRPVQSGVQSGPFRSRPARPEA